jgi:hypothetical protein
MRYYLGQCEYKWSHAQTHMEKIWVQRELGDELFKTVESNGWRWTLIRSNSASLPSDIYCRCDIFVDSNDDKLDTHFALRFTKAQPIPIAK